MKKDIQFNGEELRIQRIVKEIRAEVERYSDKKLLDYMDSEKPSVIQDYFGIRIANGEAKDNWRRAIREAIEMKIFDGKLRNG